MTTEAELIQQWGGTLKSLFSDWLRPRPSLMSLLFHAFIQGVEAGRCGADHRKDCMYATNDYRCWWMHGCIVGNQYRLLTIAAEEEAAAGDEARDEACELKRQLLATQDAFRKQRAAYDREYAAHLDTIAHRDQHEERINSIVQQLGLGEYESSWTSLNDPSERAVEAIAALQARLAKLEGDKSAP